MILKVLAIAVVLVLVYFIFFKKSRKTTIDENAKRRDEKIEDVMVECPACGTYVSKKEAILSNGFYFCSKECLKKGRK